MNIEANVKSISKLKDYFFIVPDYQREYVWKPDDQVEQFIADIDNEFDPSTKEQKGYFIGSIIIVENNNKYDVIDGQQRLTTIILSLCAFRDILQKLSLTDKQKKYLAKIEELLSDFDIESDDTNYRLELQYEESKTFLQHMIDNETFKEEDTPSIIRMRQAYAKLFDHFTTYKNIDNDSLIAYLRYFIGKIELVVIESEDLSSALKIFETINQRGAGLNAMDLVKNLLFSHANAQDFEKIKIIWKEITTNLHSCGEGQSPLRFLRYFLMARYYFGIMREDFIYKWLISPEGKKATDYENSPLKFAKELNASSKRYSKLVTATQLMADGGEFPSITNIGFINKYRSRQHLILLLALEQNAPESTILYLGTQLESFFFYSNTIGIQAKYNERLFTLWAAKLRNLTKQEEIEVVIENTMVEYVKEKLSLFKASFLNISHWNYNPLYRKRYVLGSLENTVLSLSGIPIKGKDFYDDLQVEHILPQTPKDGVIPEEFIDNDDYTNTINQLGNVTLLESSINQAVNRFNDLSSNWFEKKQIEYVKSSVVSTNLLNHNFSIGKDTGLNRFKLRYHFSPKEWTKNSIQARQKILLDLAFETWKFNNKRIDS
ncbi:MAG: DUF262 domain-containing protein [Bacteroidetes bacterium]|nr:MAG: DUF262 domain-containing protein [Bacteroidota bacterium]MBL1144970.1 DUF262 domain-containing protein [Bacteroidota bacterium]NOG57764.1 DUF262 domain-containing protein [Bacteroidota bacterium]